MCLKTPVYHFTQYSTETCLDSVDVNGGRLLGTTAMDYKDSTGGAWDATTGNIYVSAQGTESKYWYICKANNVTGECPLVVDIPGALGKYGFGVAYAHSPSYLSLDPLKVQSTGATIYNGIQLCKWQHC